LLYAEEKDESFPLSRAVSVAHHPSAWRLFEEGGDVRRAGRALGLSTVFDQVKPRFDGQADVPFDLIANAFYFLASWSERHASPNGSRRLYSDSVFRRLGIPQDIVDRYLNCLIETFAKLDQGGESALQFRSPWTPKADFSVVLSHDVDFIPSGLLDNVAQVGKTIMRHLVRQRAPMDAFRSAWAFGAAMIRGRDPYGCIPEIIAEEQSRGVRSSFQIAVAHRHKADVNYNIKNDRIRDYLRAVVEADFDLCLHGSYRSTEREEWYAAEVRLLEERLVRPLGSRQHFLSFDYDVLFAAQEGQGIQYDMSMGFPDRHGPRAGFSHPYFPFDLRRNRPFDVLEISLFYMDVTLRSYLQLNPDAARALIESELQELKRKRAAVSIVWHPIVFGGARDPGYDRLYWSTVDRILELGGLPTDGRTVNAAWRNRAIHYRSFEAISAPPR
jgi:hypothetical protein